MLKGLSNLYKGILIYHDGNSKTCLVSFIYSINPAENRGMMSEVEILNEVKKLENFFKVNTKYTIELVKIKGNLTDFDYLAKYENLKKKLDLDIWNKDLHKYLIYGNGKLIQSKTKGTFKHSYYLKVSVEIGNLTDEKEMEAKHSELKNLLAHFPYIKWMLTSDEIIRLLLEENRFFKEELINITKDALVKQWIIH